MDDNFEKHISDEIGWNNCC